jgi:hypothetical protein
MLASHWARVWHAQVFLVRFLAAFSGNHFFLNLKKLVKLQKQIWVTS